MTTERIALSTTESMRKWREFDQKTKKSVSEQGRILINFIEMHRDEFEALKVQGPDQKSGESTSMVRMKSPYEWTHFYHDGNFYITTRQRSMESRSPTGRGLTIVGMLIGKELAALWNDAHFAQIMFDEGPTDGASS